jgi:anti-sigma regulatory factor (Ser/Thr protein kinase)
MIQKTASANQSGASLLKEELWRFYEAEHWAVFLSEFWFGIIVDETLGNALLHGGKRADDELIVQIFESDKFLDFYVIDMGKGFDPTSLDSLEDGDTNTGKGIYILKKLFQVEWNFLGNEVRVRVSKNPNENPKDDRKV